MTSAPVSIPSRQTSTPPDATLAGLPVELADSVEACQQLREPWLRLRERCGVQSPNTDPDRFLAVVGAMDDARPHLVLLGPRESPRAMIVARTSRRRAAYRLGYLKFPSPVLRALDVVYEGLLTDGQPDSFMLALAHLVGYLRRRAFDTVSFNHLRLEQAHSVISNVRRAVVDPPELHWRFELVPRSYEHTIARLSPRDRSNIRRKAKRLTTHFKGNVRLRLFTREDELDEFMSGAVGIIAGGYQGALQVGLQDNALWRAMLSADACSRRLRCYWLEANGEPIAHETGAVYANTYHGYATAFLPKYHALSPGQMLLIRVIEDLCAVGVRCIDWGFGDAEYKRIYGTECWVEQSVRLYGRTARATVAWLLDVAVTQAASGLKSVAERLGTLRRIKNAWRRRMSRDDDR